LNRQYGYAVLVLAGLCHTDLFAKQTWVYVSVAGENQISVYEPVVQGADRLWENLILKEKFPVAGEPGSLCVNPEKNLLFASLRSEGKLASFRLLQSTGQLREVDSVSAGADPAYLSTDKTGRYLLTAYYRDGKIGVHRIEPDGKLSVATPRWFETAENAHAIETDWSNQFVYVPHTGANAIYQFRFFSSTGALEPAVHPKVSTPADSGPRHIGFHPNKKWVYIDNEQGNSVTLYLYHANDGNLLAAHTTSTLPTGFAGKNSCAHLKVHPSGKTVYVANRGHNSIAVLGVDEVKGWLTNLANVPTEDTPRSFDIDVAGKHMVVAGQGSGALALYRIEDEGGKLAPISTIKIAPESRPWWVKIVDLD
jgi:6-phosphogluconolactonase